MRRIPVRYWVQPAVGAPAALAVALVLYVFDGLLNAMLNPIFMLAAGGISGFYIVAPLLRRARPAPGQRAAAPPESGLQSRPVSLPR